MAQYESWESAFRRYQNMPDEELFQIACTECKWAIDYLERVVDYQKAKDYLLSFMATFAIADDGVPRYTEYEFIAEVWKKVFFEYLSYDEFEEFAFRASDLGLKRSTIVLFQDHFRRDEDFAIAVSNLGLAIGAIDGNLSYAEKRLAMFVEGQ